MLMRFLDVLSPTSEDTLLSHDDALALSPSDAVSFATEQLKDPGYFGFIQHLNGSVLSSDRNFIRKSRHFVLLAGIRHRKNYSSEGSRSFLVAPSHIPKEVLMSLHKDPTAGHLVILKTYEWRT